MQDNCLFIFHQIVVHTHFVNNYLISFCYIKIHRILTIKPFRFTRVSHALKKIKSKTKIKIRVKFPFQATIKNSYGSTTRSSSTLYLLIFLHHVLGQRKNYIFKQKCNKVHKMKGDQKPRMIYLYIPEKGVGKLW